MEIIEKNQHTTVEHGIEAGHERIAVTGPFDRVLEGLLKRVGELTENGATEIELDFAGVTYMTSEGIACLIRAIKLLQAVKGRLSIASATDDMKEYIATSSLNSFITIL